MSLAALLADLRRDPQFMANVVAWQSMPAQPARSAPLPPTLHPALVAALRSRRITALYTHQAEAVSLAQAGHAVTVVTPTASGKSLCYHLPVLHDLYSDPTARALYLFPTKALAQDQLAELKALDQAVVQQGSRTLTPLAIATYDGDTPSGARPGVRRSARLLLTNPDMLHTAILPYHSGWADFLGGLRYVVIDEMHAYRGIFGSHVANVLRRLGRVCAFYAGSIRLQFICTSATIANPGQLGQRLTEQPMRLVTESGAPRGAKEVLLYNPPLIDPESGLRRSGLLETQALAARAIQAGAQTIVFARSRLTTELLLTYLRAQLARRSPPAAWRQILPNQAIAAAESEAGDAPTLAQQIRGYRGGYLPAQRRAIEAGLRSGQVRGVVTTNALELGIDIGQLQVALLCGYPGSIASTWQQMGRAGRTQEASLALLVATADPLDQYLVQHPDYLFANPPEQALIHPDNLVLLVDHLRCAVYELPFAVGERFGHCPYTEDALQLLIERGQVQRHGARYLWSALGSPASQVSLRSAGTDVVLVQARRPDGPPLLIGEVDRASAPLLIHTGAVYLHEGQTYLVEELDLDARLALVTAQESDYYTSVDVDTEIQLLAVHDQQTGAGALVCHGDLLVRSQVVGFRRVRRMTHETLGSVPLDYPPQKLETSGYWFSVTAEAQARLEAAGQWFDSANAYGPDWQEQRAQVRERDKRRCTVCGVAESGGRQHDVHHLHPFRTFGYVPGQNEHYREANQLSNLALVCRRCHRRLEARVRVHSGLQGLAYALANIAPLHLMCDRRDLGVSILRSETAATADAGASTQATITLFERVAAGLGFSLRLFELHATLLADVQRLVAACPCRHGCPACVGPVLEGAQPALETKQLALSLLVQLQVSSTAPTASAADSPAPL